MLKNRIIFLNDLINFDKSLQEISDNNGNNGNRIMGAGYFLGTIMGTGNNGDSNNGDRLLFRQ